MQTTGFLYNIYIYIYIIFLQASGVQVASECKEKFEEMKLKHQHKYVIFKLSDDLKNIVVDCTGNKGRLQNRSYG